MADSVQQELRQDVITKQWVVVAPTRDQRPKKMDEHAARDPGDHEPVEGCPFCPGNEEMLPRVIWELDGSVHPSADWRTRAVPNKYPALTLDPDPSDETCGIYRSKAGIGHQEVVIDTPYHYESMADMSVEHVEALVHSYVQRYRTLRETTSSSGTGLIPFIFRNHGADAGASLPHPHSQIIATEVPPPDVEHEERRARAHHAETGRCVYCEMIGEEQTAGARLVYQNDSMVAFVPYAARVPYETWILPRTHEPEFGRVEGTVQSDLADALRTVLHALYVQCGNPDYNYFVRSALDYRSDAPHLHWSLRIRPRTSVDAGFELSTGLHVNATLPEQNAQILREGIDA